MPEIMFGSDLTNKENIELFVKNNFLNVKDFEFIFSNGEWFEFDSEGYHCKVWKNVKNFWYGRIESLDGNYSANTSFPERKEHKIVVNCLIHVKELHDHMTQYFPQEC